MERTSVSREDHRSAWERLYASHGLQYGGQGEVPLLTRVLKPGAIVMDAGCGDGKTTEVLCKRYNVVGCDFSREALRSLRSQRPHLQSLELVECELSRPSFDSERFDAVSCVHTLSHIREDGRPEVAAALSSLLKKGGYMFVEVFGCEDIRFGQGEEVEPRSFMRGNGILTHYFEVGEVPSLFSTLACIAEVRDSRHISFGAIAGKRDVIRTLMRKESSR